MYIEFSKNRLAQAGSSMAEAIRYLGVPGGRKYIQRIAVLKAVDNFNQLFGHRALQLHLLKGDRAGLYAMRLTGNYRLIIEKIKEDRIRIMDVEDYHGD